MSSIDITNSGPIEGTFSIDLSPGPGVYEFRGKRGSGKTTCISSIDWLSGHKVDITVHDNEPSGRVEGFGAVAPIGGRKRRKGNFELDTIDAEKFSLTDILDPQGKTPEVRDATRIKALAVLSEAKADPELYYELAGGQAGYTALGVTETSDPVALASRIKAAYDKAARQHENVAQAEAKHAAPLEHVPDDVNLDDEADLAVLGTRRDEARDTRQRLHMEREQGMQKEQEALAAKKRLDAVREDYCGLSIEDAEAEKERAVENGRDAKQRVEDLEQQLKAARAELDAATADYRAAEATWEAARSHAAAITELTELCECECTYPSETDVAEAAEAVTIATDLYERGVRIRDIKQNRARAQSHREAQKVATKAAEAARNHAGQVFDVLAQSLNTKHLEIKAVDGSPRLYVQHPKRGRCAFDQVDGLSDGERVDYTLRELLPHIETPGILPIPQRVWQDLQPSDRDELHQLAVEKGLYIFGAQVDDGELRVVFLEREAAKA